MIRHLLTFGAIFATTAWAASLTAENTSPAAFAQRSGLPAKWTAPSGMEFVLIPPGSFTMGLASEKDAPPHRVQLTEPFYLATREMTQAQWKQVTGKIHSTYFPGDDHPINCVTYVQITQMLKLLQKEIPGIRLPTEVEWEYAARAGDTGELDPNLEADAWTAENSDNTVRAGGLKPPNAFGLYDILGNVWEWCSDFYDADYYSRSPESNPTGPQKSLYRYAVIRGGSALFGPEACRYGNRAFSQLGRPRPDLGLRLAFGVTDEFRKRYLQPEAQ